MRTHAKRSTGLLRSCGFIAKTYPDTSSLIATGRADQVECLVLDVWLPGQSGLDFQASLKERGMMYPLCSSADTRTYICRFGR